MNWSDKVRYCSMCLRSPAAQDLSKRAKQGRKLTQKEITVLERYSDLMVRLVGTENKVIMVKSIITDMKLPPELILNGDYAVLTERSGWLVDRVTEQVIGKFVSTDKLEIYPNPIILINDLVRILKCSQ